MRLMVICMAVILAIGFLLGGRLRNLSDLTIEWSWLALIGLALQFVTGPGSTVPLVCLYVSFALLIVFTIKNIRVFGFPVILAGVLCNLLVIGINGGMPVSKHALRSSDQGQFLGCPRGHEASLDRGCGNCIRFDEELLREIAAMFLEEAPQMMEALHAALNRADARGLERAAHNLKGCVGNFSSVDSTRYQP